MLGTFLGFDRLTAAGAGTRLPQSEVVMLLLCKYTYTRMHQVPKSQLIYLMDYRVYLLNILISTCLIFNSRVMSSFIS